MRTNKFAAIFLVSVALILSRCAKNAEVSQTSEMQKTIEQNLSSILQITGSENPTDVTAALVTSSADTHEMVVGV